jgi:hypothetical protein
LSRHRLGEQADESFESIKLVLACVYFYIADP